MSSQGSCSEFRAHHMRPEKCRKCFRDKADHAQPAAGEQGGGEATSMSRKTFELELRVNELNREQLIEELRRLYVEKLALQTVLSEKDRRIANHDAELEKVRKELARYTQGREQQASENCCKECGFDGRKISVDLETSRAKCNQIEGELEEARKELRSLEHEIEEMHDNFKEEESEQFEQVKQELDVAMKNCKILQIRLNKAERQYNQLEQVKSMLERQLEEAVKQEPSDSLTSVQASFVQCGNDFVKLSTSEYDQLLRDLNDTIERERDLQEQIKYSQEEAQLKGDRLQAAEAENEVLLSKVNKLTLTNSRLRSSRGSVGGGSEQLAGSGESQTQAAASGQTSACDMIEQNEQLKLALDLAQSECERLRAKLGEAHSNLEIKVNTIKELEAKRLRLEEELQRAKLMRQSLDSKEAESLRTSEEFSKLELESRQLRSRLIRSERESKQLKAQLDLSKRAGAGGSGVEKPPGRAIVSGQRLSEAAEDELRYKQVSEQCERLAIRNKELEKKIELLNTNQSLGPTTNMEKDLLEKLKRQLDASESELAKTRSRLVEINLEYSQIQRKYKRLVESLENTASIDSQPLARRTRLPPEPMREPMSRQELRQAIRDLEEEIAEWLIVVKSKDCLLKEFRVISTENKRQQDKAIAEGATVGQQKQEQPNGEGKTKVALERQHSIIDNLKMDISNLEKENMELQTSLRMLERKCSAMEEELDKLRQVNGELRAELEESRKNQKALGSKLKDLQASNEKLRSEANHGNRKEASGSSSSEQANLVHGREAGGGSSSPAGSEPSMLSRDLGDLKLKNNFLMRQLEMAREEGQRQLEDLKQSHASQQRRAVELAQLELKERHLADSQILRDELNELKQKLVVSQRQLARSEEEVNGERERLRSLERDWRRENNQWNQRLEQLEAQMSIEKRSNEFKVKEAESLIRDKERELISLQDKYVQLERDYKRLQNKYNLLEENGESRQKQLARDLESKKRELAELRSHSQTREEEYYDNCKRFNNEKAALTEALESIKRSYDEKLLEIKSVRELLLLRQEQAFKERTSAQEKIDQLAAQLMRMSEFESQTKLLSHQAHIQDKQMESLKRELAQLKEDRTRTRARCEDLERKNQLYEKQELISKTSSISPTALAPNQSFLRSAKNSLQFNSPAAAHNQNKSDGQAGGRANDAADKSQHLMIEKLSSKINDQRHLMNLLKQQLAQAQAEVKQLKLLQTSERNQWQNRVTQLTGRLNECEEKILFESSQMLGAEVFESSRKRLEAKWVEERQNTLNLLQQQQSQNEILMRDLSKLSQTHELLRLQSKQLESQNNRMSRKLIEYQQQMRQNVSPDTNRELEMRLRECLSHKLQLETSNSNLEQMNRKLMRIVEEQAKPLVETVAKMMASIEGGDARQGSKDSASLEQASAITSGGQLNSLHRPLFTSTSPAQSNPNDLSQASESAPQQRSRFSRFLSSGSKAGSGSTKESAASEPQEVKSVDKSTGKSVKKVRVKSSSLGITPSEKKQLKRRLEELTSAFGDISRESAKLESASNSSKVRPIARASSELADRAGVSLDYGNESRRNVRGISYTPTRTSGGSESPRVVHWTEPLDQSDVDSERSWSLRPSELSAGSNLYKRFPQSSPSNYLNSLTDYDSETSLASECSTFSVGAHQAHVGRLKIPSKYSSGGAESDSGMQTSGVSSLGSPKSYKKKRGIKVRLTSTLRNISRSISGLASDSDANNLPDELEKAATNETNLREIRV